MRLTRCLAAGLLLATIAPALAAQNYDTVTVKSEPLAKGVYIITGSGGNIGLAIGNDAVFVIDDQFAPLTPKILATIRALTPKPVRFVINTHWHFDHTGGNENMAQTGAVIFAHDNVRKRMSTDQFIAALNRKEPASPHDALPLVTFADGITFHINGDSVIATHLPPAHTDGDVVILFTKANVLHTGDIFVSDRLPFVDLSSGGSIDGFINDTQRLLAMSNASTKIIPGHGPLSDRPRLQAFHDMLVVLKGRMQKELTAKKTLDQVLADSITKSYAKDWPTGHDRFVRLLYQEMTTK